MADGPVLLCVAGASSGRVVPVEEGGLEIGRSPENDLIVEDDDVSRFHARLLFENGSLWIRDAGSRNGVFVNDKRIPEHKALKVGDRVRIGSTIFQVRWADEVATEGAVSKEGEPPSGQHPTSSEGARRWYWPFRTGSDA